MSREYFVGGYFGIAGGYVLDEGDREYFLSHGYLISEAVTAVELIYLRPSGDIALDGWTDQADGITNIVQAIDETSASDSDYVQSPVVAGGASTLKVRLFDDVTEIADWTHTDIADTFADAVQTLTTPQFEAISSFANLFVEFDDNQGNVYRFALGDPAGGVDEPVKVRYRYKKLVA